MDAFLVFFEITVDILEDQVELVLGGDDFLETDDVGVIQFFEERDFPDGSWGNALILVVESDLLESNDLVGDLVPGLIYDSIGALSNFVDALVAFSLSGGGIVDHDVNELKIIIKINKDIKE